MTRIKLMWWSMAVLGLLTAVGFLTFRETEELSATLSIIFSIALLLAVITGVLATKNSSFTPVFFSTLALLFLASAFSAGEKEYVLNDAPLLIAIFLVLACVAAVLAVSSARK